MYESFVVLPRHISHSVLVLQRVSFSVPPLAYPQVT